MNANVKFEVVARAFQLVTGMMAPGKDCPAASIQPTEEIRMREWIAWREYYRNEIEAMLQAVDEIILNKHD